MLNALVNLIKPSVSQELHPNEVTERLEAAAHTIARFLKTQHDITPTTQVHNSKEVTGTSVIIPFQRAGRQ